ncbi:transporter substrate-binding domain-containing protein [Pseudomonas sp. LS1212]|uniref:substrate-binding periplasmic protein n=1 Tax=Pseudomonas sp. LS1212 TaxID=2972478 RepID=UPI00215B8AF3|nr:transporter substrate-binding domain-containing protein [Pseudomonas sp. LS1212]UVJ43752.1 transporter substrate-binding domain-containing protein [Pseudomonas sp. LS1212]
MPSFVQLLTALLITCLSFSAHSEKLRIVTEPWAPYVYLENGKPMGLDYEATALVFQRLGIEVEWQFLPWKRCLAMVEQGQADGILDIFQTAERDSQLYYPSEPLSEVEFVLFYANARPRPFQSLDDLRGLTIGVSPGYTYSEAFRNSSAFKREPAPTHEANFGKLSKGRIDLVITDRRVGQHVIKSLGLENQISELPMVISRQKQYLAVRRNVGMDLLAQRFAAELKRFKREPAYAQLSARYANQDITNLLPHTNLPAAGDLDARQTVEQQESSTP